MEHIKCFPENNNIFECSVNFKPASCDHSDDIWLQCKGGWILELMKAINSQELIIYLTKLNESSYPMNKTLCQWSRPVKLNDVYISDWELRCGRKHPQPDGMYGLAECDPDGDYPCCETAFSEKCGNTTEDCSCVGCIDYREVKQWRDAGETNFPFPDLINTKKFKHRNMYS